MALNASGTISMGGSTAGQSINLEMGYSATATITLNDTAIRGLGGKASGAISLSDFYGKANTIAFEYMIVSGGGTGGSMGDAGHAGGGGGAGGMIFGTYTASKPSSYTVTVGGAGGQSSISGVGHVVVYAGGGGGRNSSGGSGGSGGGGSSDDVNSGKSGGAGTAGQGNNGGSGGGGSWVAGGGGGKGSGGGKPGGGAGYAVTWTGVSQTFASGANGGVYSPSSNPGAGAANTGNGGGGGGTGSGKSGGSGIVMIRYLGAQTATGGSSIVSSGGYTVHTFTGTTTFSIT